MIVKINIKKQWITEAKKKSLEMGVLKYSITRGKGNIIGFLGEIAVKEFIKAKHENTYDYDLTKNNLYIDVKTKRCRSKPKDYYECNISAHNTNQNCSHYIFTMISDDYKKCWILGYLEKNEYFKIARFCKKGTLDKKNISNRKWRFKADCYNIEISKLKDIKNFLKK